MKKEIKLAKQFKNKLVKLLSTAKEGKKINKTSCWLYIADIAELINFCNAVITNDIKLAYRLLNNMDTPVEELVPSTLYRGINYRNW